MISTVLALETSSEVASVALLHEGIVRSRETTGVQTHSQTVLPMAQALLAEAGLSLRDCGAIAFGCGPGSFTGVRTACGIAQGLAFGAGLPVTPVVSLLALAHACRKATGASDVLAMLDARMGEVYWAQYRYDNGWLEVSAPTLSRPHEVLPVGDPVATGNALVEHGAALPPGLRRAGVPHLVPHAVEVAELGLLALDQGRALPAAEAQPLYLRNKVALTTAERQARAGA
jgi:tRNA threonylcarbamoyladenosine biosynthesis protein TsaB